MSIHVCVNYWLTNEYILHTIQEERRDTNDENTIEIDVFAIIVTIVYSLGDIWWIAWWQA